MRIFIITFLLAATSCALSLDSNIIRSSKELMDSQQISLSSERDSIDVSAHNIMRRRKDKRGRPDCTLEQANECRGSKKRHRHGGKKRLPPEDTVQEKVPEMGECLRSRDCEEGLCCAQYLTSRRCQRVPKEGEACPLRGRSKYQRNPDRCECGPGLQCRAQRHGSRERGVCQI